MNFMSNPAAHPFTGDSRRLLSVGSDGRARLWDSAAGSEIATADFQRGFGVVEAGGFTKCDLSVNGSTMAGCTARGQVGLSQAQLIGPSSVAA